MILNHDQHSEGRKGQDCDRSGGKACKRGVDVGVWCVLIWLMAGDEGDMDRPENSFGVQWFAGSHSMW